MANTDTRTTTVRLPRPVYDEAQSLVEKQKKQLRGKTSLNDFFVAAIKAYLKLHHRRRIDAAFAGMAEDASYQKEATLLAEEFEQSDWEALQLADADLKGELPQHDTSSSR
jgi:hypothetical protein